VAARGAQSTLFGTSSSPSMMGFPSRGGRVGEACLIAKFVRSSASMNEDAMLGTALRDAARGIKTTQ
jgi:hypothetical protein